MLFKLIKHYPFIIKWISYFLLYHRTCLLCTYAQDSSNAEEWVRCLSIVVAHSQAREEQSHGPLKTTTSIPRSFTYGYHSSNVRTAVWVTFRHGRPHFYKLTVIFLLECLVRHCTSWQLIVSSLCTSGRTDPFSKVGAVDLVLHLPVVASFMTAFGSPETTACSDRAL